MHHGKKMPVTIRSNFDHIKPLKLNGKDKISNLQALCANCHQLKTREDRKAIALAKHKPRVLRNPWEINLSSSKGTKVPKQKENFMSWVMKQ